MINRVSEDLPDIASGVDFTNVGAANGPTSLQAAGADLLNPPAPVVADFQPGDWSPTDFDTGGA